MIKQDWMVIVAGYELVDAMEAEQKAKVPWGCGGFKSEELCAFQREQSARGINGVEIVKSIYGHSVRYDSGLQNFGLLARSQELGGTLEAAERFACNWVAQDPSRRYAWRRRERVAA
jgi:hypothetical protein